MKEENGKNQKGKPENKPRFQKPVEWEETFQKIKELLFSKMGLLLLAGVLLFLLSSLFSGQNKTGFGTGGKGEGEKNGGQESSSGRTDSRSGSGGADPSGASGTEAETLRYLERQEERLKAILEQVEGIGKVEVMLSVSSSREKVVLSDNPYSQRQVEETDAAGGTRRTKEVERSDETVYESSSGSQTPYVVKELEPELSGVLVLAEGAGSDAVKAEIVEAVEALFGLPAHRIKVIKRRG